MIDRSCSAGAHLHAPHAYAHVLTCHTHDVHAAPVCFYKDCQPAESTATSNQLTTDEVQVYSGFFNNCVASLKKEKLIVCSPRGQKIRGLLDHLEHDMCVAETTEVATMLLS